MAKIIVHSHWDEIIQEYIPDNYTIVGEGNVTISNDLLALADERYVRRDGDTIYFGPYILQVIGESTELDAVVCRLVSEGGNADWWRR